MSLGGLSHTTSIGGPASRAVERLKGDPGLWLPRPVPMHGAHEFDCTMRLLGRPVSSRVTVGESWIRSDTASRRLKLQFPDAGVRAIVDHIEGDLFVESHDQKATLSFRGRVEPAGLLGRMGVAGMLARRLVASMVGIVAGYLGGDDPKDG